MSFSLANSTQDTVKVAFAHNHSQSEGWVQTRHSAFRCLSMLPPGCPPPTARAESIMWVWQVDVKANVSNPSFTRIDPVGDLLFNMTYKVRVSSICEIRCMQ